MAMMMTWFLPITHHGEKRMNHVVRHRGEPPISEPPRKCPLCRETSQRKGCKCPVCLETGVHYVVKPDTSLATIKKPPNSGGFFISYFSASALYAVSIRARYFSTAARSSSFMSSRIVSLALIKGMILCHALATD
mgnify:CR=1 FL=1